MKRIFAVLILCFVTQLVMGQKIELYKKFGGVRFTRNDSLLSERQVSMILFKDNKQAYDAFKRAKKINTFSSILGFTGGALIAIPVVTAISGGTPEWGLAAGGAALVIASVPVNRLYKSRTLDALDIYNGTQPTSKVQPSLYFGGNRAGLIIKF